MKMQHGNTRFYLTILFMQSLGSVLTRSVRGTAIPISALPLDCLSPPTLFEERATHVLDLTMEFDFGSNDVELNIFSS